MIDSLLNYRTKSKNTQDSDESERRLMGVYENIREMCDKRKIAISRLEADAQVANGIIGHWKHATPRLSSLMKVAQALDVPVEVLLYGEKK